MNSNAEERITFLPATASRTSANFTPTVQVPADCRPWALRGKGKHSLYDRAGGKDDAGATFSTERIALPFLPGYFELGTGKARDYTALSRFHYIAGRPATWARVVRVRYFATSERAFLAGVAVLSHPVLAFGVRDRALGWSTLPFRERIVKVNESVRTISRVVVHPRFRGLGLSVRMIRWLVDRCDTRYIDAIAMMGEAHPLFKRAGMTEVRPEGEGEGPSYYYIDREELGQRPPLRTVAWVSNPCTKEFGSSENTVAPAQTQSDQVADFGHGLETHATVQMRVWRGREIVNGCI